MAGGWPVTVTHVWLWITGSRDGVACSLRDSAFISRSCHPGKGPTSRLTPGLGAGRIYAPGSRCQLTGRRQETFHGDGGRAPRSRRVAGAEPRQCPPPEPASAGPPVSTAEAAFSLLRAGPAGPHGPGTSSGPRPRSRGPVQAEDSPQPGLVGDVAGSPGAVPHQPCPPDGPQNLMGACGGLRVKAAHYYDHRLGGGAEGGAKGGRREPEANSVGRWLTPPCDTP